MVIVFHPSTTGGPTLVVGLDQNWPQLFWSIQQHHSVPFAFLPSQRSVASPTVACAGWVAAWRFLHRNSLYFPLSR